MMSRKFLFLAVFSILGLSAFSQMSADRIYFGVKGGMGLSWAKYSELKNRDPKMLFGGVGGVFAEFEFGENRLFSIRPEVDWLSRGTKISDSDLDYKLKAKYVDVRLPLIFNFGDYQSVRPYVYVAPVVGFVRGGDISLTEHGMDYKVDVSEANMANTYFAGAVGAGVKIPIHLNGGKRLQFALEANYQYGFTDTYSDMEKSGEAIAVNRFWYDIRGNRKLQGLEITASLSVPLSIFKRTPKKKVVEPVYVPEPVVVEEKPVVVEEKPCYTLEEIMELLGKGESITGKTICAIDIINFEFDKSTIKKESYPYLDKIVRLMKNTPIHVVVRGHTDNVGDADYNMELSKKRAEAVYNYLLKAGVEPSHLSYEYYGMTRPISTNDTPEGRLMNRRVEFEITE
ncbi:OmpA family protein [Bacteroides gallinaceum]|uniref:OmpA family protein n=1 Tax=Bacteroides gallinaceum TaxID=1462571 RepID=UPI0025AA97CB|nr:OmpA family protein [Bacteroides gallinaceum]MDN0066032.1 OmpA family protein [Bacteroides gallinaceum]